MVEQAVAAAVHPARMLAAAAVQQQTKVLQAQTAQAAPMNLAAAAALEPLELWAQSGSAVLVE